MLRMLSQWMLCVAVAGMLSSCTSFREFGNDSEAVLNARMDVVDQKIAACELKASGATDAAVNSPVYEAEFSICIKAKL